MLNPNIVIGNVVHKFNAEKVHSLMALMGWTWPLPGGYRAPTADEIRDHTANLLHEAFAKAQITQRDAVVCSGGIKVIVSVERQSVEVSFEIESLRTNLHFSMDEIRVSKDASWTANFEPPFGASNQPPNQPPNQPLPVFIPEDPEDCI